MTLNTCISSNQTKYRQGIRITSASVIHAYFNTNLHINFQSKYRWFPYFCSIFNWFLIKYQWQIPYIVNDTKNNKQTSSKF